MTLIESLLTISMIAGWILAADNAWQRRQLRKLHQRLQAATDTACKLNRTAITTLNKRIAELKACNTSLRAQLLDSSAPQAGGTLSPADPPELLVSRGETPPETAVQSYKQQALQPVAHAASADATQFQGDGGTMSPSLPGGNAS